MSERSSKIEKEKRIFTIQGWIIDGVQDYLIEKQIMNWGIGRRQMKRYVGEAYRRWRKDAEITIEQRRDARIAELQQDIRGMDEKFKKTPLGLRTILSYKKELSKLENLYPIKKVQLSNDPENPVSMGGDTTINQVSVFQLPDNNR
ncbi:hypothetical protein [Soonwooa sp.]|uniref:hypothetical protein n=1 Tax=Soonwooa sp. TaxID=1938592 RepID=UPI0028A908CE|nr:hypothetical protein [Soonwooa sp.]